MLVNTRVWWNKIVKKNVLKILWHATSSELYQSTDLRVGESILVE